jgi:diphthamide synthase (EF-2-diphthine--ammonia ligase)
MTPCIFNWSGGKDSALALYHCLQNPDLDIRYLVTTINDEADRISMHGVRTELLIAQAASIGIPLYQIRLPEMPDMATYDTHHARAPGALQKRGDYSLHLR